MSPELLTGIGSVTGYAVGIALEQQAIHTIARNHREFLKTNQIAVESAPPRPVSVAQKIGRALLAPLAITAAVAGGLETFANISVATAPQAPTTLELAIDHSAATSERLGGTPVIQTINRFAKLLAGSRTDGRAFVAGSDTVEAIKIADLAKDQPFGDAPLRQALQNALDQSGRDALPAAGKTVDRQSGVVFITNGNQPSKDGLLIDQANRQGTAINVINVEQSSQLDKATLTALQQLAKRTNGKYWNANETNVNAITKAVQSELVPTPAKHAPIPHRLLLNVLGATTIGSVVRQFVGRKNNTTGRRAKGE